MKSKPTVLVLGAGSSKKFGLPLGDELREYIAKDLNIRFDDFSRRLKNGSATIVEALRLLVRKEDGGSGDINHHRAAAVQISGAMGLSSSIDEYIERHRNDTFRADCAKLAIAKAIVEAERGSTLYTDPNRNNGRPNPSADQSWLAMFFRDITRGLEKTDLKNAFRNIYIINFNYDRCVEHFVNYWLQQVYELNALEAVEIVRTLRIYHPYGSLGELAYQNASSNIPFGAEVTAHRLIHMAKRIRTYSEAREDDAALSYAHTKISQAESLIFLGFGFLQQNLELLAVPPSNTRDSLTYYASTTGIPEPRWELFQKRLVSACNVVTDEVIGHAYAGDCEEFWNEYGEPLIE